MTWNNQNNQIKKNYVLVLNLEFFKKMVLNCFILVCIQFISCYYLKELKNRRQNLISKNFLISNTNYSNRKRNKIFEEKLDASNQTIKDKIKNSKIYNLGVKNNNINDILDNELKEADEMLKENIKKTFKSKINNILALENKINKNFKY